MGPPFFWAIRNMVGNSALYASKASEIADCVVDQVSVGTVVTQPLEEEEEPKKKKAKKGKKGGDGKTVAATDTTSYPIQMETDPRNRCIYAFATILNVNDEETTKFVPGILNKVKTAGGKEVEKSRRYTQSARTEFLFLESYSCKTITVGYKFTRFFFLTFAK